MYEGQIIRVADEFDAITSKRQYKTHIGVVDTLKILIQNSKPGPKSKKIKKGFFKVSVGKNNKKIVEKLIEIVAEDTEYEIYIKAKHLDHIKNEIKRYTDAIKYYNKAEKEKKESKSKKAIINHEILRKELKEKALEILKEKKEQIGKEFAELERVVMLKVVDDKWMEHLDNMEDLRNGIGLRGYAQKDPVVQYRIEGTYMFEEMITEIKLEITKLMMHVYKDEHAERTQSVEITGELVGQGVHIDKEPPKPKTEKGTPVVNKEIKVGRNEKCPCGSGKKYKNCCGKDKK